MSEQVAVVLQTQKQVVNAPSTQVSIVTTGSQGPPGPGTGDWNTILGKPNLSFTFDFNDSTNISCTHNMQKKPAIRVLDNGGTEWFGGTINYVDLNNVTVSFTNLFSGTLILS